MARAAHIPPAYDPREVEKRWSEYWLARDLFRARVEAGGEPFCIVIPPPNVTGSLHMGHALDNTIQDILIRSKRMQGWNSLWLPGTDHAGIATQVVVEADLARRGLTRQEIGRERFIELVWEWKNECGSRIVEQLKKLGCSCDWSRERFTMDEGCSTAVREVFVGLYRKGLVYRGDYVINWCPRCRTALSDLEVEREETAGTLYYLRYPLEGRDDFITVATVRPETILGDTGVAVNPRDARYARVVGSVAILPLVGRRLPIVADELADPEFGTGAVKVTPAHDPGDFEMGGRHGLESIVVIDEGGVMNARAGRFAGLDRFDCREAIVRALREGGYLVREEPYVHALGHCSRCDTVVEPLLSKQWFVKMAPLARPAAEAVRQGRIRFVPDRFTRVYLNWVDNIRDWCVSRQLWWGHRIPAWYCEACAHVTVATVEPAACERCGQGGLAQDPDVLDTWFSSALWPFSTLGWPEDTEDLRYYYPTSVLVTGYDIIFFWVARMIFMGLEFTGQVPFRDVLIHGLVRDAEGRKMSKSRGNTIDPLDSVETYGADALRFALITGAGPGNDTRIYDEKLQGARNFANKVWNASRFILLNLEDFSPGADEAELGDLSLADRWIRSRYNRVVSQVGELLAAYELAEAARVLHEFIWGEFCDWYIEMAKPSLSGGDERARRTTQRVLWSVHEGTMRLLHPFMPFITEEIWQRLPHRGVSIVTAPWPSAETEAVDEEVERRMSVIMDIIRAVRSIRADMGVPPGRKAPLILRTDASDLAETLKSGEGYIRRLASVSRLVIEPVSAVRPKHAASCLARGVEVYVPLKGLIDFDRQVARLEKDLGATRRDLARSEAKLADPAFLKKAPPEIVETEKARQGEFAAKVARLEESLGQLRDAR